MSSVTQSGSADGATPVGDLTGQTIGDYVIERRLGRGGMGSVYLAQQLSLKRRVALKFLKPELAANDQALKRFRAEAEAIARMTHANIVQVYAIVEWQNSHFIALEYVDGLNLRDLVARKGPLTMSVSQAILRQVSAALQCAGEAGIIHRDIKPENILVTRKVEAKVADFGLSRLLGPEPNLNLTESGMTLGTPMYMSPEQVRGHGLDPRSDIYSLGVTTYFMLAGRPPFEGQNAIEVALKHCEIEPPKLQSLRPELPGPMCELVHRMMDKDPAKRPQSGRDVQRDLAQISGGGPSDSSTGMSLTMSQPAVESIRSAQPGWSNEMTTPLPRANRRWRPAILGGALLAAAGIGACAKLLHNQTSRSIVVDDQPQLEFVNNHERMLLLAVEEQANPKPDKVRESLAYHVRLGVLYFEQRRWDEAERLFEGMQKRPDAPQPFLRVGAIGSAIALSFRDDAESSARAVRQFGEIASRPALYRPLLSVALPPEDAINLKYWMGRALDRLASLGSSIPPGLERMREETRLRRPSGPASK
jgi:serine/threonine-protein kinase